MDYRLISNNAKFTLLKNVVVIKQGALYTLESCSEGYVSGAKDGVIKFWDVDFKSMATIDLTKSRDGYKGKSLFVGRNLVLFFL